MSDAEKPLVTFALFAYNQEQYIREAVEGAFSQTYEPLEIILSDDCSSDRTFEIMQEMVASYVGSHRVILVRNNFNKGLAGHINSLLARAGGEIICWAAGDDVSMPGKVDALISPMIDDSAVIGTHSYVNEIDEAGDFLRLRIPPVPDVIDSPIQVISHDIEVISQSHAFRRVVWDKFGEIGGFVTNESLVMAFREAFLGKIILVRAPLTNYRIGSGVSTQRGKDLESLVFLEPVKYARWWATAYEQIVVDANFCGLRGDCVKIIEEKRRYHESKLMINEHPWQLRHLIKSIFKPNFSVLLRAFVRRNLPKAVMGFVYTKKGWL